MVTHMWQKQRMSSAPLSIDHNKALGSTFLVVAIFILGVAVLTGQLFPQAITGTLLLLVSIGYLTQPALVVGGGEIQFKNMLGMTVKRRSCSLSDITIRDGKILVGSDKVSSTWMLDKNDIAKLHASLSTH